MAVGLGIFASYGAVIGLLNAFGQPAEKLAVLVPSEGHAGGD